MHNYNTWLLVYNSGIIPLTGSNCFLSHIQRVNINLKYETKYNGAINIQNILKLSIDVRCLVLDDLLFMG